MNFLKCGLLCAVIMVPFSQARPMDNARQNVVIRNRQVVPVGRSYVFGNFVRFANTMLASALMTAIINYDYVQNNEHVKEALAYVGINNSSLSEIKEVTAQIEEAARKTLNLLGISLAELKTMLQILTVPLAFGMVESAKSRYFVKCGAALAILLKAIYSKPAVRMLNNMPYVGKSLIPDNELRKYEKNEASPNIDFKLNLASVLIVGTLYRMFLRNIPVL